MSLHEKVCRVAKTLLSTQCVRPVNQSVHALLICWSGLILLTRFAMETLSSSLLHVLSKLEEDRMEKKHQQHDLLLSVFQVETPAFQLQRTSFQQMHGVSQRIKWSQWSGESDWIFLGNRIRFLSTSFDSSSHWSEAKICQQLQLWFHYWSLIGDGLFIPGWGILAHDTIQDSVMTLFLPRHLVWTGPCQRQEGRAWWFFVNWRPKMGVPWGTPSYHPFLIGIFHDINHHKPSILRGTPMTSWKPPWRASPSWWDRSRRGRVAGDKQRSSGGARDPGNPEDFPISPRFPM